MAEDDDKKRYGKGKRKQGTTVETSYLRFPSSLARQLGMEVSYEYNRSKSRSTAKTKDKSTATNTNTNTKHRRKNQSNPRPVARSPTLSEQSPQSQQPTLPTQLQSSEQKQQHHGAIMYEIALPPDLAPLDIVQAVKQYAPQWNMVVENNNGIICDYYKQLQIQKQMLRVSSNAYCMPQWDDKKRELSVKKYEHCARQEDQSWYSCDCVFWKNDSKCIHTLFAVIADSPHKFGQPQFAVEPQKQLIWAPNCIQLHVFISSMCSFVLCFALIFIHCSDCD